MIFQLLNPANVAKDHLSVNQTESYKFIKYKNQNWFLCKILIYIKKIIVNIIQMIYYRAKQLFIPR